MYIFIYTLIYGYIYIYIYTCTRRKPANMAEKRPRFRGPRPSWELAWTMNWVDRLRTSADKRMWSGRRAVVMVR